VRLLSKQNGWQVFLPAEIIVSLNQGLPVAVGMGIVWMEKWLYTVSVMGTNKGLKRFWLSLVNFPRRVVYSIWAEVYSRYEENFNPAWREPLPSRVCELCGKPGHQEAYCPNAKEMGFLD
jgi:hypothetical protein